MAEPSSSGDFDDLDAFFSAAASADTDALHHAAQSVAGLAPAPPKKHTKTRRATKSQTRKPPADSAGKGATSVMSALPDELLEPLPQPPLAPEDLEGKFIAVDPEAAGVPHPSPDVPFILIPAHIHSFLPWWGWLAIGVSLAILILGILLTPGITLDRLTARLGDHNHANAQSAMAQLVIKGDERTVARLYEVAMARDSAMDVRLRAVDTLSLIEAPDADRALLRLELANNIDAQVREAAIAARRQREAAKTRNRNR